MKPKNTYKAIGLMSGTSLDGLDIACCIFTKKKNWQFEIESALTIKYSREWKERLSQAHLLAAEDLAALDVEFGNFMGDQCRKFIVRNKIRNIDIIASHGHTIFHQPQRKFTFQLGNGSAIHALTGLPVIFDFRSLDVVLGGEGAPLVPVGDRHLFGDYDVCLNVGGIANLSQEKNKKRIAFDICYANMGLNYLAQKNDQEFDLDGRIASRGVIDNNLLANIAAVYKVLRNNRPSLGREGFELNMLPLLNNDSISLANRMHTFCQSIANEIQDSIIAQRRTLRMLVTGGGALNSALMNMLSEKLERIAVVEIPDRQIIEYKEALVFAFLGVLRARGEINVLRSVTRAERDSCSGVMVGVIHKS